MSDKEFYENVLKSVQQEIKLLKQQRVVSLLELQKKQQVIAFAELVLSN